MYREAEIRIAEREKPVVCAGAADLAIHQGDQCVIDDGRLKEFGQIVNLRDVPEGEPPGRMPRILRRATLHDQARADENVVRSRMARGTCAALAEKRGLALHLLSVHYSFERDVLHVSYAGGQDADLRDFAKDAAAEVKARVDLRSVGVRDEARILGGLGTCGRVLCCRAWLQRFESINVRMAKAQNLALNPMAMSGACGRLKCCLRYEVDVYQDLSRQLPRQGADVECPGGQGCVIGRDILAGRVTVRLSDRRVQRYDAAEVRTLPSRTRKKEKEADNADSGAEWPEPGAAGEARAGHLRDNDA